MQFLLNSFLRKSLILALASMLIIPMSAIAQRDDKSLLAATVRNIGNDDVRGEDLSIRRAAVEALGNRAGTVVVMSPQSGRVYTIVNQNWGIRRGFKPCSTIKLVTGIAGYSENLIKPNGNLRNGSYRLGLDDSLAYSNNSYFQKVGKNLGSKKMISYARKLGLGERTGINASGEFRGKLPYGNENLRIYSHADDFKVTPLQLAVMVSAIANGGDLVVPQTPRSSYSKANFQGYYRRALALEPTVFERVIPGMAGAVKYGTARRINNSRLKIAGKTGSCISKGTWVGLFASVAPIIDPKFAVVVITEGKYARGKYSAAVAGKIYHSLRNRFNDSYNGTLAKYSTKRTQSRVASNIPSKKRIVTSKPRVRKSVPPKKVRLASVPPSVLKERGKISGRSVRVVNASLNEAQKKKAPTSSSSVIKGKTEITRPRIVAQR